MAKIGGIVQTKKRNEEKLQALSYKLQADRIFCHFALKKRTLEDVYRNR
jgi:hypothetical protein